MKNLLYILALSLLTFSFSACSDDDDNIKITANDVIGTYVLKSFIDDKGNLDPIGLTQENIIEFKSDYSGERFSLKEQKIETFTWSISKNKILFTLTLLGDAQCTLDSDKLTVEAKSEYSGNMGTYVYMRD